MTTRSNVWLWDDSANRNPNVTLPDVLALENLMRGHGLIQVQPHPCNWFMTFCSMYRLFATRFEQIRHCPDARFDSRRHCRTAL